MRRLSLVTIALLLLLASSTAWAAGPAGSARDRDAAERTSLVFKALLGQLSEVFSKMFAAEGPSIDPLGRTTVDNGPHIDPLGGATSDEGPKVDPWGGASTDEGPDVDPWG
jgi:hypothetical protein